MKWLLPVLALLVGLIGGYFLSGSEVDLGQDARGQPESGGEIEPVDGVVVTKAPGGMLQRVAEAAAVEAEKGVISKEWLRSLEDLGGFEQFGALYDRVKHASAKDFPALIDSMGGSWGTSLGWQTQSLIAARWAEVDPNGLMKHIEKQPNNMRWTLSNALFGAWARTDSDAALTAAQKLSGQNQQNAAISAIAGVVSIRDPQRAVAMIAEHYGNSRQSDWAYRSIFTAWAKRDPDSARDAAMAMADGPTKTSALTGALSEWIQSEPMAALEWLDALPVDSTVYNSRKQMFSNLLNSDLDLAKQYVESRLDPLARREVLRNLHFSNLAWSKDFEEIKGLMDWVGTVAKGQNYDQKISELVRSMAESDSAQAIEFVLQMPPGQARMNSLGSIGSKLAESDPAAALAFVESLAYEDERQRALNNMSWQLARNGIENVSVLIAESENPEVQQQLSRRIAEEWSSFNREAALSWAVGLVDDRARNDATQAVIKNWMQSDPAAAFDYIENSMDEGKQGSAFSAAFSDWARQDPEAAVAGLDQLPESDQVKQADIYNRVAQAYVQHDPMAASEWISTLDDGPERDATVKTLVSNISKTDPEAGFIWSATITDENARKNSLKQTVQKWVKDDPDAAYDAVKDSKMDVAEKEPLFELIEKSRK